jgi:outer membrane protein assembly factor BamB
VAGKKQIVTLTEKSIVGVAVTEGDGFVAKERWSNDGVAVQSNTPVLKDNLLFGYSNMGNLFCINAQNGETAWVDTLKNDRGGFAAILDAGQVILALPSSAELIVIKPVEDKYTELARIKMADTPTYAHPVIAGNSIYLKDEETLTLWEMK